MSWAEIKKAVNSNLDVPLNEQLGQYELIPLTADYPYNGSGVETEIINLSGNYLIYLIIISGEYRFSGTYSQATAVKFYRGYKIIVDDEILDNAAQIIDPGAETSYYQANYYYGYYPVMLDYSGQRYQSIGSNAFYYSDTASVATFNHGSTPRQIRQRTGIGSSIIAQLGKPIKVNSSFKIVSIKDDKQYEIQSGGNRVDPTSLKATCVYTPL